jgi:NitT/TauT family transport system ATP-binding protein
VALEPVDLEVRRGEFVVLLGESGCGKTTLLRIMAGLLAPEAGAVEVDPAVRAAGVGFVFQEPTLMPWARVRANVRLPLELRGMPRAEADARADEALARVGLQGFAGHRPHELSGGMRMRVSIARGLATRPALLLMDEPFGALDELTRWRLDDELLALTRDQRLTVVFVTHSLHEAAYLADRVLVMAPRPGRIVAEHRIERGSGAGTDRGVARAAGWRTSTAFAEHAAVLHAALLDAGADSGAAAGAARA